MSHKRVGRDCEPKIIKINKCGEGGLYPTVCVQGGEGMSCTAVTKIEK